MKFIHFAFDQWEAANKEDVHKYVYACPFLLVLSGRDVTLKSRRVASKTCVYCELWRDPPQSQREHPRNSLVLPPLKNGNTVASLQVKDTG